MQVAIGDISGRRVVGGAATTAAASASTRCAIPSYRLRGLRTSGIKLQRAAPRSGSVSSMKMSEELLTDSAIIEGKHFLGRIAISAIIRVFDGLASAPLCLDLQLILQEFPVPREVGRRRRPVLFLSHPSLIRLHRRNTPGSRGSPLELNPRSS